MELRQPGMATSSSDLAKFVVLLCKLKFYWSLFSGKRGMGERVSGVLSGLRTGRGFSGFGLAQTLDFGLVARGEV